MPNHANPPSVHLLLQHLGWLRGLARQLVRDPHAAEDAAQETMITALARPPRQAHGLRAWLGKTLRHRVLESARRQEARSRHERRVARDLATPPTSALLERVQIQERLAAALLALDEPYRRTVLLRFYDDLPPREIARREGTKITTVKSRLQRGLARLRAELDRTHEGGREAWLSALTPIALGARGAGVGATPTAITTAGGILMQLKTIVPAAAILLSAGLWIALREPSNAASPAADDTESIAADHTDSPAGGVTNVDGVAAREPGATRRRELQSAGTGRRAGDTNDAAPATVRGRALRADGGPAAGLRIVARGGREGANASAVTTTSPTGHFAIETEASQVELLAADDGWVTVRPGVWTSNATLEPVVVATPALPCAGRVVDLGGVGVAGATIEFAFPLDFTERFEQPLDASKAPAYRTTSRADGSFALATIPAIVGASLRAAAEDHHPTVIDAPLTAPDGMPFDAFGRDVAIEGNLAVVGAPLHTDADALNGQAYVYRRIAGTWTHEQTLVAPGVQSNTDEFGVAVALSNGRVYVGSAGYGGLGAVFIYDTDDDGDWILDDEILGSEYFDQGANGSFGGYLDVNNDRLIAAAPTAELALILGRDETTNTWSLEATVEENPPSATPSGFGSNVALDGDVAVVGSPSDDTVATNAGAVYVFRRQADGTWAEEQKLFASDASSFAGFGGANGVSCRTIVTGGDGQGYVFTEVGGTWQEVDLITAPGGEEFGGTLGSPNQFDVSGDVAVLGAAGYFAVTGRAYVYRGFSGRDCNGNGIADACDILAGTSDDTDANGLPDECVAGDVNGDGSVGLGDLLALLASWGECADDCDCPTDFNGDGAVDLVDLLTVLANWTA